MRGYHVSQRKRKLVEQVFGVEGQTVGALAASSGIAGVLTSWIGRLTFARHGV